MNNLKEFERKNIYFPMFSDPLDRVQYLMRNEYDLERLRTVSSVDPQVVCKTLSRLRKGFYFVYNQSNQTLNNVEVITETFDKVGEVGKVLGVEDDGYDQRAHQLLGLLQGRSSISEGSVRNVSGKQLLMVLGALGVAFRSPEHKLIQQGMLSYFREARNEFEPDYYFAISMLLGLRNGEVK